MKRSIDFSAELGTPDEPFTVTIDSLGIGISTEYGRTQLTPAQFEVLIAEVRRYERALEVLAQPAPIPLIQAAE